MPLETIYVTRHGFRSNWLVDPVTGVYSASIPSPTGIPADPALTSHGVNQAKELGRHLLTLDPPIEAVYSSPYYRCLQTINPFIELRRQQQGLPSLSAPDSARPDTADAAVTIRPEHGLREWFGSAPFHHPEPASSEKLKSLFPAYDESYVSARIPSSKGETLAQLQDRIAATMRAVIKRCDAEGKGAIVLCSHAAVVILLGRILTGQIPDSVDTDDFQAYTCGLSVYRRRQPDGEAVKRLGSVPSDSADASVIGDWNCLSNSDCSFLSGGEERGWRFVGDESFPGTGSLSQFDTDSKL